MGASALNDRALRVLRDGRRGLNVAAALCIGLALCAPAAAADAPSAPPSAPAASRSPDHSEITRDLALLRDKVKGVPFNQVTGYLASANVLARQLKAATSDEAVESIADQVRVLLVHADAMVANRKDKRSKSQARAAELGLISHHALTGKVVFVSVLEQVARLYEDQKLVATLPVVTGRPQLPTPPGFWRVQKKRAPFRFVSLSPVNDPYYYPASDVKYALQFRKHFYLHDAPWRSYFGAGANLPHEDPTSPGFSDVGSHGCINMSEASARRLYLWAALETPVLIY